MLREFYDQYSARTLGARIQAGKILASATHRQQHSESHQLCSLRVPLLWGSGFSTPNRNRAITRRIPSAHRWTTGILAQAVVVWIVTRRFWLPFRLLNPSHTWPRPNGLQVCLLTSIDSMTMLRNCFPEMAEFMMLVRRMQRNTWSMGIPFKMQTVSPSF